MIAWHFFALLMIAVIVDFICTYIRDNKDRYLGISSQLVAIVEWIILTIMAVLIYGGIFWW